MLSYGPTRRITVVLSLIAATLAVAGAAFGQVATPSMNPVTVESMVVTPFRFQAISSPATLPWSGSSRVGISKLDLEAAVTAGGVTTDPSDEGDGLVFQGRLVGETFAVAAELFDLTLTDLGNQTDSDAKGILIAGAGRFGDLLSVGIAQQASEFTNPNGSEKRGLPMAGISIRLAEVFFLGAASGTETVENSGGGVTVEGDRGVTRIGVGYLMRDGDSGFRVELFKESVDSIDEPTITENEIETDGFAVEANFSGLFVGYESVEGTSTDLVGVLEDDMERTKASVGWVPMMGLSVVLSVVDETVIDLVNPEEVSIKTTQLGVAWIF